VKIDRLTPPRNRIQRSKTQCSCDMEHHRMGFSERYMKNLKRKAAEMGWNPDLCLRWATHVIDGKHLCSLHAGIKVLSLLDDGYELKRKENE
jgi:hypothetical protein